MSPMRGVGFIVVILTSQRNQKSFTSSTSLFFSSLNGPQGIPISLAAYSYLSYLPVGNTESFFNETNNILRL